MTPKKSNTNHEASRFFCVLTSAIASLSLFLSACGDSKSTALDSRDKNVRGNTDLRGKLEAPSKKGGQNVAMFTNIALLAMPQSARILDIVAKFYAATSSEFWHNCFSLKVIQAGNPETLELVTTDSAACPPAWRANLAIVVTFGTQGLKAGSKTISKIAVTDGSYVIKPRGASDQPLYNTTVLKENIEFSEWNSTRQSFQVDYKSELKYDTTQAVNERGKPQKVTTLFASAIADAQFEIAADLSKGALTSARVTEATVASTATNEATKLIYSSDLTVSASAQQPEEGLALTACALPIGQFPVLQTQKLVTPPDTINTTSTVRLNGQISAEGSNNSVRIECARSGFSYLERVLGQLAGLIQR